MKKILMWVLAIFMALVAIVYFPSITSVIAIIFAVIAAPIKPLQDFFADHGLRGLSKGIVLCAAFIGSIVATPLSSTADNASQNSLPVESTSVATVMPTKGTEPSQVPEFTPEPTLTPEPTSTPDPVPVPTLEPTPTTTPEPTQEPVPDLQPIRGRSPDTIVYVSRRSNTIHSVHDCSGMRNYREMTIYDATSRNYDFCSNCW